MNISKIYKKIKRYRDRDQSKLSITPFREWIIILFVNAVFVLAVICFSYYAFNIFYIDSFKEEIVPQTDEEIYNIKTFQTELSETIWYYEKREKEHSNLLNEQPLFKINAIGSVGSSSDEREVYNIGDNESSVFPEGDILPKIFNQIKSSFSNTASVWRAFFIDLSK